MLLYFLLLLRGISWFESQKCMIKPYHTCHRTYSPNRSQGLTECFASNWRFLVEFTLRWKSEGEQFTTVFNSLLLRMKPGLIAINLFTLTSKTTVSGLLWPSLFLKMLTVSSDAPIFWGFLSVKGDTIFSNCRPWLVAQLKKWTRP